MGKWTVTITILNNLDRELVLAGKLVSVGNEESFPERIGPGEQGVYTVTSPARTPSGIQFTFSLQDMPPEEAILYGTCRFSIEVPLFANNKSSMETTGAIGQVGYVPIGSRGHDWACTVTLYSKLDESSQPYQSAGRFDWASVGALPEMADDEVDIQSIAPQRYVFVDRLIGRAKEWEIPRRFWHDIKDPLFTDDYGQQHFVARYFTTAIYRIKKNTSVSVAANQSYSMETMIHHRSSTRSEISQEMTLENNLRVEHEGLTEELRASYRIARMDEYCAESEKTIMERLEYSAVEYDRDVVVWDLDKLVALYRENINGKVALIGLSDYYVASTAKTYTTNESEE